MDIIILCHGNTSSLHNLRKKLKVEFQVAIDIGHGRWNNGSTQAGVHVYGCVETDWEHRSHEFLIFKQVYAKSIGIGC